MRSKATPYILLAALAVASVILLKLKQNRVEGTEKTRIETVRKTDRSKTNFSIRSERNYAERKY